jgi:hypothetical protein
MLADRVAIALHHFARHGAEDRLVGEQVKKARRRLGQLDLQRVAVERAQAFHGAVVVERLARLQRLLAQGIEPQQAGRLEHEQHGALPARVIKALPCVHIVRRDELARLAAKGRIIGEQDARL